MLNSDQQTCDYCKVAIEKVSIDVQISSTTYDENHDVAKVMERHPDEVKVEYLVFCKDCEVVIVNAWNDLVDKIFNK